MLKKTRDCDLRARLGRQLDSRDVGAGTGRCKWGRSPAMSPAAFGFVFRLFASDQLHLFRQRAGRPQHYVGAINKFGVDIGYLQGGVIVWTVVAPTANSGAGLAVGDLCRRHRQAATVGVGGRSQRPGRGLRKFSRICSRSVSKGPPVSMSRPVSAELTLTFSAGLSREEARRSWCPARPRHLIAPADRRR